MKSGSANILLASSAVVGGTTGVCLLLSRLRDFLNVRLLPPELRPEGGMRVLAVQPWRVYKRYAKTLGPIFSIRPGGYMPWLTAVFGFLFPPPKQIIILDTAAAVTDLFQKRSEIFSDRPRWPMVELLGRQDNVGFTRYGARLRAARRLLHEELGPQSVGQWEQLVEDTVDKLMADWKSKMECSGQAARYALRRNLESLMFRLTYGKDPTPEYLELVKEVNAQTGAALQPGRWLINYWPFLAYVPTWMPGAYFQRWAQKAKLLFVRMVTGPYEEVKAEMRAGQDDASFVSNRLHKIDSDDAAEARLVMTTAGSIFSAGVDTTDSLLETLFTLLSHHPEVQEKAYAEIIGVVSARSHGAASGKPSVGDRELLPSVNYIIMESLRFNPPVPMLIHSPLKESMYNGWRIPKGSWMMGNMWSIFNNEEQFAEPRAFKPERFLDPTLLDPTTLVFGAGRRRVSFLRALSVTTNQTTQGMSRYPHCNNVRSSRRGTGHIHLPYQPRE
ncbi:cytochrome P450 [Mycena polygramma]|nr:cytochrome P450 [Mycena polygramma]